MIPEVAEALLVRKALFPALLVIASIVIGAVVGVQTLVHSDRAAPLAGVNSEDYSTTDAEHFSAVPTASETRSYEVFDIAPAASRAIVPSTSRGSDEGGTVAVSASSLVASSASFETDKLRGQILRVAREFPGSSRRDVLVRRLASVSPMEALACLAELPEDESRRQSVSLVASDWVSDDPAAAIAAVAGFQRASIGREFHFEVVAQLARTQPARALALVKSLPSSTESLELFGEVFRSWATTDPRLATARALELEQGTERSELLADVLTIWARLQMNDAVRAVIVLPDPSERRATLAGVVRRLARTERSHDIALSAAFVRAVMLRAFQVSPERDAYDLAASAVDMIGQLVFDAVIPFVDALPAGYDRSKLLTRMVSLVAPSAPDRAAAYAMMIASGAERVAAIRIAASGMVRSDEASALQWLEGIANVDDRAAATQAVFFEISDLALAERWLQRRMAKADADAAIQAFVLRVTREDPPLAASWARQIRDLSLRYFAIEAVARAWMRTNRPASEAWLARTDLPETRVNRLLAR